MPDKKSLPKPLTDLPKPDMDLPLPPLQVPEHSDGGQVEKELTAHVSSSGQTSTKEGNKNPKREFHFLRSFILGFLFVIFVVLVGGGVFMMGKNSKTGSQQTVTTQVKSPSPNLDPTIEPISKWKTYKGETIYTSDGSSMFTIKYPPGWALEENKLHSSGRIPKDNEYIEGNIIFQLGAGGHGSPPPQEQKLFSAGKFDYYWENGMVYASISKNNISYIFYVYGEFNKDEVEEKYKKIFDLMLSTFKFTVAREASNTTDWKTYTNTDIGYMIKYPDTIDDAYYRSSVGSFLQFNLPNLKTKNASEKYFTISDMTNNYESFKEFMDIHVNQNKDYWKITRAPFTLSGIKGEVLTELRPGNKFDPIDLEKKSVWIQTGSTILIFQVRYQPSDKERALSYFDQMLSTFKFN